MARASFNVDLTDLNELGKKFLNPQVTNELSRIAAKKEISALVAQAIADNFAKESGLEAWPQLKGATIRASVAKNAATKRLIKDAYMYAARKIGAIKVTRAGKRVIDRAEIKAYRRKDKTQKTFLNHVDEFIEQIEKAARKSSEPQGLDGGSDAIGNRQILRRTSLLYQTVTTRQPGFTGTVKSGKKTITGSNINRVEGTNLIWGTNLVYAGVHNYGYAPKNIPKREFLVLRQEWEDRLYRLVLNYMNQSIRLGLGL